MNCQILVQSINKSLKIVDLYFGNKDGVDTLVTGHPSQRKLDNPYNIFSYRMEGAVRRLGRNGQALQATRICFTRKNVL
jgi:hypothetical protein